MNIEAHGGGCCGVTHIYNFWKQNEEGVKELKRDVVRFLDWQYDNPDVRIGGYEAEEDPEDWANRPTNKKFSCILEACLTDDQMMFWAPHMKEAGFKVVNRFLNSNSGNVVNVLHYNPAGRRKLPKVPYKW